MKKVLIAMALLAIPAAASFAGEENILIPQGAKLIPGSYIVVLKPETNNSGLTMSQQAVDMAARYNGSVTHVYDAVLNGFAIQMNAADAGALSNDSRVAYVEQDSEMSINATQTLDSRGWGLDRIDQRLLPLNLRYNSPDQGGVGVRVYVIDTGIRTAHTQFGGRASNVFDAFGGNGQDCNGHGTHVAGTVGGSTWGVAKRSMLRGVRVLDCNGSGSTTGVIAGVNFVARSGIRPAVANMSLGGGASTSLDTAVNDAVAAGVPFAVAAGNSNANACNSSPARAGSAITVGATTRTDARSSFSNFGTCLDVFAPGSSITSAGIASNTATATFSGTSMASPHVAGAAALLLSQGVAAGSVRNTLVNNATTGRVTSAGTGSPNRLLFVVQ